MGASNLLANRTLLTATDYVQVLRKCRPGDLVYVDPPYQGVCGKQDHRYAPRFDHNAFCDALAALNHGGIAYLVSYDGRTGNKKYGRTLPGELGLTHVEVHAGRSSQATLLGRNRATYESIYLSPALAEAANRSKKKESYTGRG
jgi:DNA adenine methylase